MNRIAYLFVLTLIWSCSKSNQTPKFSYPKINKVEVTDTIFGKVIEDPYRGLENAKNSQVKEWYYAQGNYADSIIGKITNIDELAEYLTEIDNRSDYLIKNLRIVDDNYFYLKKEKSMGRYRLFHRQGFNGDEKELYSPLNFKPNTKNKYVINYMNPSHDGRYVAIGLTYDGREYSEIVIFDTKTAEILPEIIDHCWPSAFYGVDWLPDNTGFIYLHFPHLYEDSDMSKSNSQSVMYKIGQNPKALNIILSAKNNPELKLNTDNYPIVQLKNKYDRYIVANMVNVTNSYDAYYINIEELKNDKPKWKKLYSKEDGIYRTSYSFYGDTLYFRQTKNAPNQKISKLILNDNRLSPIETVVEEIGAEVIKGFNISRHGLYYTTLYNGVEAKLYQFKDSKSKVIELPKASGNIALSSRILPNKKISIYLSGWLNSSERYEFDLMEQHFKKMDLRPSSTYPEFENFFVEEIEVIGHDGVMIPLSIIRQKNIPFNSTTPVFLDVYGAYGDSTSPYFSPVLLTWVAKGGIYAFAHARGGGEKGSFWHKSGQKTTKSNTWKDLISCMEYLIEEKYTSKENSIIWGSSAGGIAVGRAMIEKPNLFKVAIAEVAALNQFRSSQVSGGTNFKEFGSVNDSIESMALIEMDAYLKLKNKTQYPATLITAGMNDPRVAPWESGKFVARLQEESTSDNPILFCVYKDSGHGGDTTIDQIYYEWANTYAFAFWQTGHPDYQLKN